MNLNIDRPIEREEEDKLYYNELYAGKLEQIISKNKDKCIKVGLFAKFGSGKTSTINILWQRLKNKRKVTLKKKNKRFIHVKSLWDYSPEDILKKIIVSVDKQANLKLNLNKEINSETTYIDEKEKRINFLTYITISLFALIGISLIGKNTATINMNKPINDIATVALSHSMTIPSATLQLLIGLITTGLAVMFAVNSFKKQTRRPPSTSYDFEDYWIQILKAANQKGIKEITLVVDDLDRCKPEIVNGIFGKLNAIVEQTEERSKISMNLIIPFSLADYLLIDGDKEIERLKFNYKKFFDIIIDMPELGPLELQRLDEHENK
ncbi:hypothetical protein JXA48_01690 [Candidatus Woesearchaeota archaeon]|nr:hypothetical protein [Candidatus Woesearchaeota archaeon]